MSEYIIQILTNNYDLATHSSKFIVDYPIISYKNIPIAQDNNQSNEEYIPISVLKYNSSFEAIVHYLKSQSGLSLKRISELTARDQRTIWNVYNKATRKSLNYSIAQSNILLPVSILRNRIFSVLESVVFYLSSEYGLSVDQIAHMLGKNYKTIYTIQKRVINKIGNINAIQ